MAADREEIRGWIERGKAQGATHMIVMCDGFGNEDYPVYVSPAEAVREVLSEHTAHEMQRLMEVYFLNGDIEAQLAMPCSLTFS